MATSNKVALKAAKAALDAKDYERAAEQANKVLSGDPNHYHAKVFLGLALERSGRYEEAEKIYDEAVKIKDDDSLVWQGLVGLYERQAGKKIEQYAEAVRRLTKTLMKVDDRPRCQSAVDKYVNYVKQHGTKMQYKEALELQLPKSEVYDYLEGLLPNPAVTYPKIAEIVEADDKQRINKLIGERKTRLGARIGQVTLEAKREVFLASPFEDLCRKVIDWSNDDDLRWLYEEKLLLRAHDVLSVLASDDKKVKLQQVLSLAKGMIIVKHPYHLAWKIALEWEDVEDVSELDFQTLCAYITHFPTDGLSKVLSGWLSSDLSPFPKPETDVSSKLQIPVDGEGDEEPMKDSISASNEERLILMTEGLEESSRSMLSQRLMSVYYLHIEEYAIATETSRHAKDLIVAEKQISGMSFQNNLDAVDISLATSLVHHQTPRYHNEARQIFESVLQRKPNNTHCLIGLGLILEEEEDFDAALDYFSRTLINSPDIKIKAEAAWCQALAGNNSTGLAELQICLQELEDHEADQVFKSQLLYRIGVCLWNADSSKIARKDRNRGYSYFISSLQANLNYAPAYTSLGIYYNDYTKDKKRARKCFQKAFELSSSEVVAAERLARSFAESTEWDLVELVAQRVIDSGKTRPPPGSKRRGLSWPYAAMGVCQLNNLDFAKSIVSFQSALRSSPGDVHSWIGLGESYHGSGRYLSATKSFQQVRLIQQAAASIDEEAAWFSSYMLANVERELGQYDEAISNLNAVLDLRPDEFGVSIALLQTHVEAAWRNFDLGLFGRAADDASRALIVAQKLLPEHDSAFNLWKAIGDSCTLFTMIQYLSSELAADGVQALLRSGMTADHYSILCEVDGISAETIAELTILDNRSDVAIRAAILSHKRAIYCCSNDFHAQAVAWYNLGWTEYRSHVFTQSNLRNHDQKSKRYVKSAVRCFKRAIELEAANPEFWNSLGIVTTHLNPKVAQHSFVRSLYLNGNSARVWTNLGILYLLQNDTELAIDAFNRGQSLDPDYAPVWIGQGILALLSGDLREANDVFTHAFEIGDSSSLIGKRLYASTVFDHLLATPDASDELTELLQPTFALFQLMSQVPSDFVHQHLASLLNERVGTYEVSTELLKSICADIEAEYEESESDEILARFAQSKADLARACLAAKDFAAAAENAETCLDLSSEKHPGASDTSRSKCRLSAHLTAGLAYTYMDEPNKAISMFREALADSSGNPDIVCLLAQVLWAKGGEEERNVAREQLLDCVEAYHNHATTIMLLAVIAVLDDDAETFEAVASDLQSLRVRTDLSADQKLQVGRIFTSAARLTSTSENASSEVKVQVEATTNAMIAPSQPHGWTELARLGHAGSYPAQMALITAAKAVPPKGTLTAEDLAMAYAGTECVSDAQRAIFLAPWSSAGWNGLS